MADHSHRSSLHRLSIASGPLRTALQLARVTGRESRHFYENYLKGIFFLFEILLRTTIFYGEVTSAMLIEEYSEAPRAKVYVQLKLLLDPTATF